MLIIIAFFLGGIFGLIFAPKNFKVDIQTKDNTEVEAPVVLDSGQIEELIGKETDKVTNLQEINEEDIALSVKAALETVFSGKDDLYE